MFTGPRPARERAGYLHEGHLRGLLEPAQAGLVWLACPFTGWANTGPYALEPAQAGLVWLACPFTGQANTGPYALEPAQAGLVWLACPFTGQANTVAPTL